MNSKHPNAVLMAGAAAAILALTGASALAQTSPLPAVTTSDPSINTPPLGEVMGQTGGSLYQAQALLTPPPANTDPADLPHPGTVAAVSFFTVKEQLPKTYKKHDLVEILVQEDSTYSSNGNSDLERQTDENAELDNFITLNLDKLRLGGIIPGGATAVPEIKSELDRDFKAQGSVDRTDTMTERITAEVVDVKPNGNLVLQAIKDIKTDEEEHRIVLTGTCKADDITADNTLLSTQLFDLNVTENTGGAVRDATKRGWLVRLLDFASPF